MKIRKEEEKGYEKDIVEKSKEQPKLFYRFVNGKTKPKETIERLKEGNKEVSDPKGLLNNKFQQVFTRETDFTEPQENKIEVHMEEIKINKEEIYKLLGELEEGEAVGRMKSRYILKKCRDK